MQYLKYIVLVAALAVVAGLYRWNPAVIHFQPYNAAVFTQQLTPLVLIALFIERSLEVFITVWRGQAAAVLERNVEKASAMPDTDAAKVAQVHAANDALSQYRFVTKEIAMPIALIMGIAISALGVRGLGNFADLDKLAGHTTQLYLFNAADVLLTGALMGGGSDFMHKIITTFTDLMDATSQKAKAPTP